MKIRELFKKRNNGAYIALADDSCICTGYTSLDQNPEVISACEKIATLISSMTIHLMANTEHGDKRVQNELSRKIDIDPSDDMTRRTWMEGIVMNMLLYGRGNAVVIPHTRNGYLENLEPISAYRISYDDAAKRICVDGVPHDRDSVLHFVYRPDKNYLWRGQGLTVCLKDLVDRLKQEGATTTAFLKSNWKPSVIVKVDALTDEFSSPQGRAKLLEDYISNSKAGEPWLIPADQFAVEQIRPLSLGDLAITDNITLDKKAVAAIIGVPAFVLGVGEYNRDEWNNFISTVIRPIAQEIEQEMTRKLILSPKMYLKFNNSSLLDYDIQTIANVFCTLGDRGYVTGNEVRDRMGLSPADGLDEYRVLENYIPYDMSGLQKKLVGTDGDKSNETDANN